MLRAASRRARLTPRPFVCLLCAPPPLLPRHLSTSAAACKTPTARRDSDSKPDASDDLLRELKEDIKVTITRVNQAQESKRWLRKRDNSGAPATEDAAEMAASRRKKGREGKEGKEKEREQAKEKVKEKQSRKVEVRRVVAVIGSSAPPPSPSPSSKAAKTTTKPKPKPKPKPKKKKKEAKSRTLSAGDMGGMSLAAALGKRPNAADMHTIDADADEIKPIPIPGAEKPPSLHHDLDRVLFNPGVHYLQDPRSRVYNFDPYLRNIMPVTDFDFSAVDSYTTSSKDSRLSALAAKLGKKYVGSTSSMTSVLAHYHYLLSSWRNINASSLSKSFPVEYTTFTQLSRAPAAVFLRYKGDGTYAIDPDKEFDVDSILSLLGRSMEKLLTLEQPQYEALRKGSGVVHSKSWNDKFHYSTLGDFLMRSQLDAYDPRLPGTGMFDLKTRAVVSVRMDVTNFHLGSGYQIKTLTGQWESFEREYFDMIRAAFLKYSLQVRMGRMDGIFVAFHNTERIFGFRYVSLDEMDSTLHEDWDSGIGDKEFKLSLMLMNDVLNRATERFPEKSLRLHFEARETQTAQMYIVAEPMEEKDVEVIQGRNWRDMDAFLGSLKEKRESVGRKVELKGIAEKFGEVLEEAEVEEEPVEAVEVEEEESMVVAEEEPVEKQLEDAAESLAAEVERASGTAIIDEGEDEGEDQDDSAQDEEEEGEDSDSDSEDTEDPDDIDLDPSPPTAPTLPESQRPLLALTLTTYNRVNGTPTLRPTHLGPTDSWTVDYTVTEAKSSQRAWATYNAIKSRRKKAVENTPWPGEDEEGGVSQYVQYLRGLSKAGRQWESEWQDKWGEEERVLYKGGKKEEEN